MRNSKFPRERGRAPPPIQSQHPDTPLWELPRLPRRPGLACGWEPRLSPGKAPDPRLGAVDTQPELPQIAPKKLGNSPEKRADMTSEKFVAPEHFFKR